MPYKRHLIILFFLFLSTLSFSSSAENSSLDDNEVLESKMIVNEELNNRLEKILLEKQIEMNKDKF
ncbi:hypothetical protein BIY24_02575 [Halobacteriovorax marinus]|uniref:hypothetical protein n=1 Tax=Halobacteriovorax marinus TaxID=97084 RepID=UPI000BC33196|nr:hypothetical protein [Halobacteriovorax marinus]ATH06861.1 hypothetical protein BIY24_02575 [Halobacteriovorax marinus]